MKNRLWNRHFPVNLTIFFRTAFAEHRKVTVSLFYWMRDVRRTASYEITLVRLSVRLFITKCSQDWIISFFSYCT